jgi:hypothetical protein
VSSLFWEELRYMCQDALQSLAAQVIPCYPHVQFRSGYGSNPAFPLRLWGSFTCTLKEETEGIDVSIDFKWGDGVVEVTADVAYESGRLLSELPCLVIPLAEDGSLVAAKAREVVLQVAAYVKAQESLVSSALSQ